jgi:putative exosortase-associated protein (TIGR04073 family)
VAPATASLATPSRTAGWRAVFAFGASILLIGSLLTLVALPWVDLPAWKIFRRCASIAAVLSLWLAVTRGERRSLASYGLADWGAGKRQLLAGLVLGAAGFSAMLAAGFASGTWALKALPDTRLPLIAATFIPAAVLIGVLEEYVFRGYILRQLWPSSPAAAVLVSSAAYALVHIKSPTWTLLSALELAGLFLFGLVLAYACLRTGQLYLAIGLHAALAYGVRLNKLWIEFPDASLAWLVGTSRVINGVISWAGLLVMAAVIAWWTRRPAAQTARRAPRGTFAAVGAVLLLAAAPAGWTQETALFAPQHGPWRKLGRGIANIFTSPLELVRTSKRVSEREGMQKATTERSGVGVRRMFLRFGVGLFEVVTFPLEIPEDYEPLMLPELAFEDPGWRKK